MTIKGCSTYCVDISSSEFAHLLRQQLIQCSTGARTHQFTMSLGWSLKKLLWRMDLPIDWEWRKVPSNVCNHKKDCSSISPTSNIQGLSLSFKEPEEDVTVCVDPHIEDSSGESKVQPTVGTNMKSKERICVGYVHISRVNYTILQQPKLRPCLASLLRHMLKVRLDEVFAVCPNMCVYIIIYIKRSHMFQTPKHC